MESPLVSILVANYNNGCFIAETLESVVKQTYPNIEIVIVDDGSTDNSLQVIDSFMIAHPDCRIKLFKNTDNKGCGRIKRQCIEMSEGDFFCFVDPDDAISSEAVSTLMEAFEHHTKCGIVYSTHYLCNEKLEPQEVSVYSGPIPEGQSHLTSKKGHIAHFVLCNRQIYNKTSGINVAYQVSEDQDLYLKMEEMAPVFYVDLPLYFYRKHEHNISWNEKKAFNNFYWKYVCEKAAYQRRKRMASPIDNFSKREMDHKSFSFYLRLGKDRWRKGHYFGAFASYLRMSFYFYSLFKCFR